MPHPYTHKPPTTLIDWLDDLTVRFLLNLPASELSSVPRLCFQVEEAQWFYEDFVRPTAPALPALSLKQFCLLLFQHCPLLSGFSDAQHVAAYEQFLAYKVRVPVRGAILLDERMEKLVLVRGWKKGASWSFPRGKINKDERDLDCAIREVYEETGYDLRQSCLIPEDENEVKHIDITMKEQQMRLFVFRGVPENTHFEPRTRKEIGKIQWYALKDLPGFRKQKGGQHDGDMAHANKFYMVAPFLSQLKKWISAQRRVDEARQAKMGVAGLTTETEDEVEEPLMQEEGQSGHEEERAVPVEEREQELKRLLSIGGRPLDEPAPAAKPDNHASDLLAMLRGGAKAAQNGNAPPRTPFEQTIKSPAEPPTPQPHHPRGPSIDQQQGSLPPQFPLSPPRNYTPVPTPNVFNTGPGYGQRPHGFPPNQMPPFQQTPPYTAHPQQHQQFLQPRHQNMPSHSMQHPPLGSIPPFGYHDGGMPLNQQKHPPFPMHQTHMPQHAPPPPHMFQQQPPPAAYMAQGPQGAIASGPAVPKASQLPPPRLTAQSMKLLDAFKAGGGKPSAAPITSAATKTNGSAQRPASTHQTALLELFRKPSAPALGQEPASPTPTDVTVRPARAQERRPTLNEITRTLPSKSKVNSPISPVQPTQAPEVSPVQERPRSRQLFDPATNQMQPVSPPRQQKQASPAMLQRPMSKQASRSPRVQRAELSSASPSRTQNIAKSSQNGQSAPFTILARPGSAKGPKPAAPTSPSGNDTPKPATFHPQVLKRPKESADAGQRPGSSGGDKKDQLLALFSKNKTNNIASPAPQPEQPEIPERKTSIPEQERKNSLLDLLQQPTPPPAPRIEPEHRPSSHAQPAPANKQQSLLLDLFNKGQSGTGVGSPGTPISPFTLGTPATTQSAIPLPQQQRSVPPVPKGSTTDVGGTPKSPVETKNKDFLMGYLNGVVKNEGYRGAGSGGGKR